MEYEVQVERDQNGRVIVDFYGLDFDITDEFVDGKCHKVIFGDPIVFVLKDETKEGAVENPEETHESHEETPEPEHPEAPEEKHDEATEEPEKHDEPVGDTESSVEPSEETQLNNDSQQGASEGTTHEEPPVVEAEQHESEQPVENTSEENHTPDDSNNENTPAEEDIIKDPKLAEPSPKTQEGEN